MRIFAACYGAEAGDMALKTLSFGGVYIAGGVAPKNMWCLQEHDRFIKNFCDKGKREWGEEIFDECPCLSADIYLMPAPATFAAISLYVVLTVFI